MTWHCSRVALLGLLLAVPFQTVRAQKDQPSQQQADRIRQQNQYLTGLNHAQVMRKQRKFDAAVDDAKRAVAIAEELYGPGRFETAKVWTFLEEIAKDCENEEQFQTAVSAYETVIKSKSKAFGESSNQVVSARASLALCKQVAKLDTRQRQRLKEAATQFQTVTRLTRQRQDKEALALASTVLATRQELLGDDNLLTAQSLHQVATCCRFASQLDKSEDFYRRALAIEKRLLGEEHLDYLASLHGLASVYSLQRKFDEAIPVFEQVLAAQATRDRPREHAVCLRGVARVYLEKHNHAMAEKYARHAVEIHARISPKGSPEWLAASLILGEILDAKGNPRQAVEFLEKTHQLCKANGGEASLDYPELLNRLALYCKRVAEYQKADATYNEALILEKKRNGETASYAILLANRAKVYIATSDHRQAEANLNQAASIFKKLGRERDPFYAYILENLGFVYEYGGKYAEAEPLLKEALAIYQARLGDDHLDCSKALLALGQFYLAIGDNARAEPFFAQALEIREKKMGKHHLLVAMILQEFAPLYERTNRFATAEKMLVRAEGIYKEALGQLHPSLVNCLTKRALLYHKIRDHERARELYRAAMELARKRGGDDRQYTFIRHNLGILYLEQGNYTEADALMSRQEKSSSRKNDSVGRTNLAWLYQATGRHRKAVETQVEGLALEQDSLRSIFSFTAESSMYASLGSISSLERLLSIAAAEESPDRETATAVMNWTLRRKGIVLDTLCRFRAAQRAQIDDPKLAELVTRWRFLRQRMADTALNPEGMDSTEIGKRMSDWKEEAEQLEAELNRTVSARITEPPNIDVDAVRQRLPKDSALIEIVSARVFDFKAKGKEHFWKPPHYYALVLPSEKTGIISFVDLGAAEPIDSAIRKLREQIQRVPRELRVSSEKELEADYRKASAELYRTVFARVEKHLGSRTLLFIAPDGELNRVPFEALVDDRGKYLVERYRMVYLASGRDLLRPTSEPAKGTVVFAGPDYGLKSKDRADQAEKLGLKRVPETLAARSRAGLELRGLRWKPLRGAAAEARDVSDALGEGPYAPVRAYRGAEALEEVFKAMKAPRILHIATHGFFLPDEKKKDEEDAPEFGSAGGMARLRRFSNPLLRSGIVLAGANALGEERATGEDGWVTAEEIALLDLRGTELVVLSACESGLGDVKVGEGVFGLRRAFFYAGAGSLLNSLFEVPDDQTREMMRSFYGAIKSGKSKLDALHEAQLTLIQTRRKNHEAAHPFFWASFVLVGDEK